MNTFFERAKTSPISQMGIGKIIEGKALVPTTGNVVFSLSHNLLYISLPPVGLSPFVTLYPWSPGASGLLLLKCSKLKNGLYFLPSLSKISCSSHLGFNKKLASQASTSGCESNFPPELLQRSSRVLNKKEAFSLLIKEIHVSYWKH